MNSSCKFIHYDCYLLHYYFKIDSAGFRDVSDIDPAMLANSKSASKQTNNAATATSKRSVEATADAPKPNYSHLYIIIIALLVGFLVSRGMFLFIGKKPPQQPPL